MTRAKASYQRGEDVWKGPRGFWQMDFTVNGTRVTGTTKTHDKRSAERIAKQNRAAEELRQKQDAQTRALGKDGGRHLTFGVAVAAYWAVKGQFTANATSEEKSFNILLDWIGEERLMSSIDLTTVEQVVAKRRSSPHQRSAKPLSHAQVNRTTVDLIKRVHQFAVKRGAALPFIPWSEARLGEAASPKTELGIADELLLDRHLREGFGPALQFSVLSGLRLENFSELEWKDVSLERKIINIDVKGRKGVRENHTVHMDEEIEALLSAQIGRHERFVFVYRSERTWTNPKTGDRQLKGEMYPVTYWGFISWWRSIRSREPQLAHLSPHAFRRTAASRIVRDTGSLVAAQKLLGHSDIRTTAKHYAHLLGEDVLNAQRESRRKTAERRASLRENGGGQSQTIHRLLP